MPPITIAGRRLWRTAEGGLVEDGDPAARSLAYGPADEVELADVEKMPGAKPKAEPKPKAEKSEPKPDPDAKADAGGAETKPADAGGEPDADGKPKGGSIMARRGRPPKATE